MTVGEVFENYGAERELSRSTIVTVMERLRKKNFLTRKQEDGIYRYSSPVAQEEILGGLVRRFVEKTLSGSFAPFMAYFASADKLSTEELKELQRLIEKLETKEQM